MRAIDFRVHLFIDEADRERSERAMHFLLHALCCIDLEYLKAHPGTPALYQSGIRYDNERAGKKEWYDIPTMLEKKLGDCKDLACARVAEIRLRGRRAQPYIRYRLQEMSRPDGTVGNISLYHVLVQHENGMIEDPSKKLGMGDEWEAMDSTLTGARNARTATRRVRTAAARVDPLAASRLIAVVNRLSRGGRA